jgi:hypothetical protein
MNPKLRIIPVLFAVATLAHSQEELSSVSRNSATASATLTAARIIGDIPDGTPPPPQPPKPEFVVSSRDVLDKKTYQQGGRSITFQRIAPIALPPPPTAVAVEENQNVPLERETTEASEEGSAEEFVMASATVFHPKGSPALSLVEVWPPKGGQTVQFWSSADFGLLSGISAFTGTDGKTRSLMLMWSASEVENLSDLITELGPESSKIPKLAADKATFAITSDHKIPAATLLTIQSLHDIYNTEYKRLKTAYEGRKQANLEREAELKANPPRPKNITLNFWRTERTEKTATDTKGGAQ